MDFKEMKNWGLLRGASLVMLVLGGIGVLIFLSDLSDMIKVSRLASALGAGGSMALIWISLVFGVIGMAAEIYAGILGIKNSDNSYLIDRCLLLGYICVGAILASHLFMLLAGGLSVWRLLLNLVAPAFYIYAALEQKKAYQSGYDPYNQGQGYYQNQNPNQYPNQNQNQNQDPHNRNF